MLKSCTQAYVEGQRVLVRVDMNIPVKDRRVQDKSRLECILPTLNYLSQKGAKVLLLSHFGRPRGMREEALSLEPIVPVLSDLLGKTVRFVPSCIGAPVKEVLATAHNGDIFLLENTRFHAGEEKNAPHFAKALAYNADIYVNDAFSVAHRSHASVEAIAHLLPSYAGLALCREIDTLESLFEKTERPALALIGGMKIGSKIALLHHLVEKIDYLAIGGGMANTFLASQGKCIGASRQEVDHYGTAQDILDHARKCGCRIILPQDFLTTHTPYPNARYTITPLDEMKKDVYIFDIGPKSCAEISAALEKARMLLWNGPVGAFEHPPFDQGTVCLAQKIAEQTRAQHLVSIAGGGDTVSALNYAQVYGDFSYVSMAGGAFLAWLEGKDLPGLRVLM